MTDIENRVVDEVEKVVKGKRDIIIKVRLTSHRLE